MQKRILDPRTRELRLRATGYGMAAVQVGYQYSLDVTAAWPSFVVNPQVFKPSTANHMQFTVCVNYIEGGNRDGWVYPFIFPRIACRHVSTVSWHDFRYCILKMQHKVTNL